MVESRWRALYKAALLELDPKQLQARVQAAMDAIHARANDARVPRDERIAMEEALLTLRIFARKKFDASFGVTEKPLQQNFKNRRS
jgi:hypothetical protein